MALSERPDITYGETPLPGGMAGMWFPDIRGIATDSRLTRVERRCALAHELVHAEYDHAQCAGGGPGTARIARRLERWTTTLAATRLIPLGSLMSVLAERLPAFDAAEQLAVTERMLHVRIKYLTTTERLRIHQALGGDDLDVLQVGG
ncbi:hypothetical protein [Embleya sp. NPDC059237]|uniref:hypothetical protein n=1 Tax=Embleya sp. NPDC059237 TaxID=3346784 RepID=UPI0036A5267B